MACLDATHEVKPGVAECSTDASEDSWEDLSAFVDSYCEASSLLDDDNRKANSVVRRKLIFLDVDGPLAPWKRGEEHDWCDADSFTSEPYSRHVEALLRIINGAGGLEVVKVVISSNWRTDADKYPWLVSQLGEYGIDVVGHTDVCRVHPSKYAGPIFARNWEIHRVLTSRVLGYGGPGVDKWHPFKRLDLPANWEIVDWIAIDDMHLDAPTLTHLVDITYLSFFILLPDDDRVANGWIAPPSDFADCMRKFSDEFSSSHFLKVDPYFGLAGTPDAEEKAIQMLNSGVAHVV